MPPQPPDVLEADAAQEAERLKLQRECMVKKDDCEREERLYNQYLQEREKINYFWIVEKKTLSERHAEFRNKQRMLEDLQERQEIELKMFTQRLKHLRYSHLSELVDSQTDNESVLRLVENNHRGDEKSKDMDERGLKVQLKEVEVSHDQLLRTIDLAQYSKIRVLRIEVDHNASELQAKYNQRMKNLREDMERQRKTQISKIEDAKNDHVKKTIEKNNNALKDIKVYYGDITSSNLDLIKRLKAELEETKKKENADKKQLSDLRRKNEELRAPLLKATQDVETLQGEAKTYEEVKKTLEKLKQSIREKENNLGDTEFQHEIRAQQLVHSTTERDELNKRLSKIVYEIHQKSGLKELLLHKKLYALEDATEIAGTQLSEMLRNCLGVTDSPNYDQGLNDVINNKNNLIAEYHSHLRQIATSHHQIISSYENILTKNGTSAAELGFMPTME